MFIELRGKDGLQKYDVEQRQYFVFSNEKPNRDNLVLRLGVSVVGNTVYFCYSQIKEDVKRVPNGLKGYRDQTTWNVFNENMINRILPDYVDGLSKQDRKLYRQLLNQFIDQVEKENSFIV